MRTIETTATITAEGTLTVQVPPDIPPGPHHVVVLIEAREEQRNRNLRYTPMQLILLTISTRSVGVYTGCHALLGSTDHLGNPLMISQISKGRPLILRA